MILFSFYSTNKSLQFPCAFLKNQLTGLGEEHCLRLNMCADATLHITYNLSLFFSCVFPGKHKNQHVQLGKDPQAKLQTQAFPHQTT